MKRVSVAWQKRLEIIFVVSLFFSSPLFANSNNQLQICSYEGEKIDPSQCYSAIPIDTHTVISHISPLLAYVRDLPSRKVVLLKGEKEINIKVLDVKPVWSLALWQVEEEIPAEQICSDYAVPRPGQELMVGASPNIARYHTKLMRILPTLIGEIYALGPLVGEKKEESEGDEKSSSFSAKDKFKPFTGKDLKGSLCLWTKDGKIAGYVFPMMEDRAIPFEKILTWAKQANHQPIPQQDLEKFLHQRVMEDVDKEVAAFLSADWEIGHQNGVKVVKGLQGVSPWFLVFNEETATLLERKGVLRALATPVRVRMSFAEYVPEMFYPVSALKRTRTTGGLAVFSLVTPFIYDIFNPHVVVFRIMGAITRLSRFYSVGVQKRRFLLWTDDGNRCQFAYEINRETYLDDRVDVYYTLSCARRASEGPSIFQEIWITVLGVKKEDAVEIAQKILKLVQEH